MHRLTLALIDDDHIHSGLYVDGLQAGGFNVQYFETAKSFLDALQASETISLSAIICDLMMPPGGVASEMETEGGLLTGLEVAKRVRQRSKSLPIVLFTNLNVATRISQLKKQVDAMSNVFLLRKASFGPFELAPVLQSVLENGKLSERDAGLVKRFFDSLILKPTIFGMGVDLKELLKLKWREH